MEQTEKKMKQEMTVDEYDQIGIDLDFVHEAMRVAVWIHGDKEGLANQAPFPAAILSEAMDRVKRIDSLFHNRIWR